ncbi:Starch-binding associating with outer membrane [bacterium A37T11]|nr:Starch-binding associating with outer membrane [bacterium A37T11]
MNRYIKYFLIIICACSIGSCKKFLESTSHSIFTEDLAFSNLDFATKAVYGIYNMFTVMDSYNYYFMYTKLDNDIEFSYSADDNAKFQLGHYAGNPGSARLETMWNVLFQTIERANLCIDNLPKSPIWQGEFAKEAHRLYGEAVTLRALCYYELIGTWGDVPFTTKSVQAGDNFNKPKTERDSIYEYIIKDLKDVQDDVPWMSETQTTERVSKAFVKGLRARIALAYAGYSLRNKTFETRRGRNWQAYYAIARQECAEIMAAGTHQLNPSFENIFRTLHAYQQDLNYKEVLFEIAFGRLTSGSLAVRNGMSFSTSDPKYGLAYADVKVPLSYFYSFDRTDTRRNISVELYNYNGGVGFLSIQRIISSNGRAFTPSKWRKSWIVPLMGGDLKDAAYTGINFPIMRYADVILMFAESENELNGPTSEAKDALSLIRKRAFPQETWSNTVTHYVDSVASSKDDFFNALVNERAWEFGGGELIRKNDLIRWNLLGPKLQEMKNECRKIINNDPKYAALVPMYIFWKYKEDGETLDILNPDYPLPGTTINGYTRTTWLSAMSSSNKTDFDQYINMVAHGYDSGKNNYLYPISGNIITASNGVLSNDQMP